MSQPTRVIQTARDVYAVDPYVRDEGGRFATKPLAPPPPLRLLEDQAQRIDLTQGNMAAWTTGPDSSCCWRVRVVRESDGGYRVLYLEDD